MLKESNFCKQYRLLLWKNIILKVRRPIVSIVEILIPLGVIFILMFVRNLQLKFRMDRCYLKEKQLDSLNPLLFIKDFLCTFNSTCYINDQLNWTNSNNSTLNSIEFQTFITNLTQVLNSFPKTNNLTLPILVQWISSNPEQIQILNNSLNYITYVTSPLLESFQLLTSNDPSNVTQGLNLISTFICGSEQNDLVNFMSNFLNINQRKKRYLPSCQSILYNYLGSNYIGTQIYNIINPIFFGKIYYTPNTNFTKEIIKKANFSFEILDNLRLVSIEWRVNFKNWLLNEFSNNSNINNLRNLTNLCLNLKIQSINTTCFLINNILKLSNIQSIFNTLSVIFSTLEYMLDCIELNKFVPVKNATIFDDFTPDFIYNLFAGIVFDPSFKYLNKNNATFLNYTIRMPTFRVDSTKNFQVLDRFWTPAPRRVTFSDMKYYTSGFLMIQEAIDRAFIELVTNNQTVHIGSSIQMMPTPCYVIDKFIQFASNLMPFFLVIAWSPTFSILVKNIVYEKEKRLKEFMLVMGLSHLVHWLAWFSISLLLMIIPIVFGTIILKYRLILEFSSPGVIFILFLSYVIAFISQAFMISVFFNKANIAAVVAGLLYFIFYVPFLILINVQDDVTYSIYFLSGILCQVSFCNAFNFIAYWEQSMEGVQFSNLFESTVLNLNFGVGHCIVMLWIDTVIYLLITWYVEAVFPGEFGIPKPWYFFVTPHYWCPNSELCFFNDKIRPYKVTISEAVLGEDNENFEEVPENLEIGISIQHLSKQFSSMKIPSVDDLSLNFYKSQITAFLGHNGAGKTTTISMLTGIFPPTSGSAYILNQDITKDIDSIRKILGLCPQHNILFDNLTVEDHIYFYGLLKGMNLQEIQEILPKIIEDVGLTKKRKTMSKQLSGGMKRKLSVAMAFIGDSKAIFLDEPTAGVDPFARRGIWDLLIKYRSAEKTIILTTHHMDEADYLSDRIAIISQGKLKCCGSSIFLKRKFGDGYYLILVKNADAQKEDFNEDTHSDTGYNVFLLIKQHVSNALFVEETRTQLTIILPLDGLKDNGFSNVFKTLDKSLDLLNISSYGLSDTSLEEVFLKVANDPSASTEEYNNKEELTPERLDLLTDEGNLPRPSSRLSLRDRSYTFNATKHEPVLELEIDKINFTLRTGFALLIQQILALEIKRFHYTKRNIKGLFSELILPVLMIVLIIGLLKLINPLTNQPSMALHPWLMMPKGRGVSLNTFYRQEPQPNPVSNSITDLYRSDLGEAGLRCMNGSIFSLSDRPCYSTQKNGWSQVFNGPIPLQSPKCDCNKTGSQKCENPLSGGPPNSYRLMASSDILNNLTGYNISDHLIKKFTTYAQKQYGGFQFLLPNNFAIICNSVGNLQIWNDLRLAINKNVSGNITTDPINFLNYLQQFLRLSGIRTNYTRIWINNKGYASMPSYANIFDNLLLRSQLNSSDNASSYGILVNSHPFKYSKENLLSMIRSQIFLEVSLSNFVILALSLIPASFVIFLIEERVSGSKRQQFVSGVNPYVYWISNIIWDIIKYLISAFLIALIFLAFSYESYIGTKNVAAFLAILCGYGFAIIPHMYPFSFLISTPSTAFVVLSAYNMFVGSLTTLTTFFIDQLQDDDITLRPVNVVLKKLFLIFPQYCLGRGMIDLSFNYLTYNISNGTKNYDPFAWTITGQNIVALFVLFFFWFGLILLIESGIFNKVVCNRLKNLNLKRKEMEFEEDVNVSKERERVKSNIDQDDILKVIDLTKIYNASLHCQNCQKKCCNSSDEEKRKLAVNSICFGVKAGECFGLLGVNGAGKTTTFKMLTGEEQITSGDAMINNKSIINDMVAAHMNMGFCPQFDALHAILTCEEELYFYCRIRGIEPELIESTVQSSFKNLSLTPHATKTTHSLSGGNKRKLSTAISLIGSPKIIFMDEPTSGMDAGARRFLWNTIQKLTNKQRSVILTSHNMEECEVLCHRLAIMVNGQFQCLGSVQQLKSTFGNDYYVTLRLRSNCDVSGDREQIKILMSKEFSDGVSIKDENFVTIQYRMDPVLYNLHSIFEFFENLKESGIILDYSVSQTTLDEIFINFAKNEYKSKEVVKKESCNNELLSFVNCSYEATGDKQ